MNLVLISGRLTREPEIRKTSTGKTVARIGVATNEKFGESERTEFHSIIAWEKAADRIAHLQKGDQVMVQGRLQTRKYEDKTGTERKITEIVASSIEFLRPHIESPSTEFVGETIDDTPIF
jgi:single-strand DNA-binding protein